MTSQPIRFCSVPGCGRTVVVGAKYGKCKKHQQEAELDYNRRRGSSPSRGYDHQWGKLRNAFLIEHPLCAQCYADGILKAAEQVDHIQPFHGKEDPLRLEWSNLQPLCASCHSRKTAKEDGAFGHNSSAKGRGG